ncbi:tail fiber domain-containing protein [Niabella pedocola]|uniref:Tail fiber domain-containing protein n=1 Tax=Niabella pedocola TaxID=1752077 RepID=A0ABS8Q1S9_9BACT|nr:tail fiber domain-containing protein [Niabella pedocola]MCD2426171.1 tail fiber domain-containing protein [Niabella pedocola]
MKLKLLLLILSATGLFLTAHTQVPLKFAFQGVARNNSGQAVANQSVSVRFTIHEGSANGNAVYQEMHTTTTGANGVFNVAVGGGTVILGTMYLKWTDAIHYLQVELDAAGGGAYSTFSTTQLLSVPYALATRNISGNGSVNSGVRANSMGNDTRATGQDALAIGMTTTASGISSFAVGNGSTASGTDAVSIGFNGKASGNQSLALGSYTEATGENSIAAIQNSKATANNAVAIGYEALASASEATAIGWRTTASGSGALAMGTTATASMQNTTAIGTRVTASGSYSTAMGTYTSTNNFAGSFIIGDYNTIMLNSSDANQMTMRFRGGYRLFTGTTGAGTGAGVTLAAGGNSWASISDSTKKENYKAADGMRFLSKIKNMKLGSWNYKGQDKKQYRHYGPMAQEFYSLFGNDGTGTIGNDTTIASADIDGVMMIALQALIKQSEEMKNQVKLLSDANKILRKQVQQLEAARKEN